MRRSGFTLLELMLAVALLTVLMIGVLGVIGGMARSSVAAAAVEVESADAWPQSTRRLVALLRDDLARCDQIQFGEAVPAGRAMTLSGQLGLADGPYGWADRPAVVTYFVAEVHGRSWLVRHQRFLDEVSSDAVSQELVAAGVVRLELTPVPAAAPQDRESEALQTIVVGAADPRDGMHADVLVTGRILAWRLALTMTDRSEPLTTILAVR